MHLQASLHHHANYLQWRRKSSRWRTTSCLTASSFRHRSWPQLRRSLSAVVVAGFGWHGRSSAASARDGARSWEKATSLPRDRPTPGWTPSAGGACRGPVPAVRVAWRRKKKLLKGPVHAVTYRVREPSLYVELQERRTGSRARRILYGWRDDTRLSTVATLSPPRRERPTTLDGFSRGLPPFRFSFLGLLH